MKLEPANIVCPACGNGNYMRHLVGKNVGYLDMKCINCNSYFNFDELYKQRIGEVLKPKPITNADRIRAMTDEELARLPMKYNIDCICCPLYEGCDFKAGLCSEQWLAYLKQEATND